MAGSRLPDGGGESPPFQGKLKPRSGLPASPGSLTGETLQSDDFLTRSGKHSVAFRKLQNKTKAIVIKKRKMSQCVFSGTFEAADIQLSQ